MSYGKVLALDRFSILKFVFKQKINEEVVIHFTLEVPDTGNDAF